MSLKEIIRNSGQISTLLQLLSDAGVDVERLMASSRYLERTKEFFGNQAVSHLPDKEQRVNKVIGDSFFGSRGWSGLYDDFLTQAELESFPPFPWSLDIFHGRCPFNHRLKIKDTHSVFLTRSNVGNVPATIKSLLTRQHGMYKVKLDHFSFVNHARTQDVVCAPFEFKWHMAVTLPVLCNRIYDEQVALLPQGYKPMALPDTLFHVMSYHYLSGRMPLDPYGDPGCVGRTSTPYWRSDDLFKYAISHGYTSDCNIVVDMDDTGGGKSCSPTLGLFVERKETGE